MRECPGFRLCNKTLVPNFYGNRPAVQGFIREIPTDFLCECIYRCANQLHITCVVCKRGFTGYRLYTVPFFYFTCINTRSNFLQSDRGCLLYTSDAADE